MFVVGVHEVSLVLNGALRVAGALAVDGDPPFPAHRPVVPVSNRQPLVSTHRTGRALQLVPLSHGMKIITIMILDNCLLPDEELIIIIIIIIFIFHQKQQQQ